MLKKTIHIKRIAVAKIKYQYQTLLDSPQSMTQYKHLMWRWQIMSPHVTYQGLKLSRSWGTTSKSITKGLSILFNRLNAFRILNVLDSEGPLQLMPINTDLKQPGSEALQIMKYVSGNYQTEVTLTKLYLQSSFCWINTSESGGRDSRAFEYPSHSSHVNIGEMGWSITMRSPTACK